MSKSFWLMSAACLTLATPVWAQDTAEQPVDSAGQESEQSPTEAGAVDEEDAGEIIVTAQGRSEQLADVPLAISAVSAETLQNSGANDIRQLNQLAPSLLVSSTGSEANGSARIRGIGTVGDNPGLESSVAVFVDGVYRSRSGIGLNELGEIERVEVLRGPQGTLFGRNASAGLIHIISKRPSFDFGVNAEATYGNYDFLRFAAGVTGPITESIAARLDGVYVQRDGFFRNVSNGDRVNDRDRYFVRGQLLFEPTEDFSVRLIGDYTSRDEACCAAGYRSLNETFDPTPGAPGDFAIRPSRVVQILSSLGNVFPPDRFDRVIQTTPGRVYDGKTRDGGVSGELSWDFGGASLTSITAYRYYKSGQGGDIDYSTVDLLYRDPAFDTSFRRFKTFTQELRLQGSLFDDRFDWLVGAYYANEKLATRDNLQFGNQFGQFLACRIVSGIARPLAFGGPGGSADDPALRNAAAPGCLSPTGIGFLSAAFAAPNAAGGTDASQFISALNRLSTVRNTGFNTSRFNQESENYAFFTHNIFDIIPDRLSLTAGLRYTNETKTLDASFANNNTVCPAQQAAVNAAIAGSTNPTVRGALTGTVLFACLFNSSSQLNNLVLADEKKEDEFTGTVVLSFKPVDDLLTYASYSRGYKAGGFNLDASALGSPTVPQVPGNVANLRFEPEIVKAYEIGFKYDGRRFNLNVAGFRQEFESFQLNTFNGLFFLVQNVNGCANLLPSSAADQDASGATGTCAADDVEKGVVTQGVEIEAALFPADDVQVTLGYTYARTKYEDDLVGNIAGTLPLATELFNLPGRQLSNAPRHVATGSIGWTPEIGSSGLSGLIYADTRLTSDVNTGSDLFPEKIQDGFVTVNGRVGLRGPSERWAVEVFVQNLFDEEYDQVAFNTPLQAAGGGSLENVRQLNTPFSGQLFSAFLGEPRTYGITVRGRF